MSWQLLSTLTTILISFAQSIIIATGIGVDNFGVFSSFVAISVVISQLLDPRYLDLFIKYLTRLYSNQDYYTSNQVIILGTISALIILIIAAILTNFFSVLLVNDIKSAFLLVFVLISVILTTHFFTIFQAVLRVKEMVKELAIVNIFAMLLRLLVISLSIVFFDYGLIGIVISLVVLNTCLVIIQFLYLYNLISKDYGLSSCFPINSTNIVNKMPEFWGFIKKLYINTIITIPQKELDIVMLTFFVKPEMVGLYRMSKNFLVAIWGLVDAVVLVIFPMIVKLTEENNLQSLRKVIRNTIIGGIISSVSSFILMWLFLPLVLEILLPSEYSGVFELTLIMYLGSLVWAPLVWTYPMAISVDKMNIVIISSVITGLFAVVSYYTLISNFGVNGAAIVYSTLPAISSVILLFGLLKTRKVKQMLLP